MDGDPAVEPELDSFSLTFPLPYRVAFVVVLGVWGWGANLHYLHLRNVDVPSLIRYPARSSPHHPTHHLSTYRFATVLSAIYAFSLLVFWAFTRRSPALVLAWHWLPLTYLGLLLALFAAPLGGGGRLSGAGRSRLRSTLRRVAVGGLAEARDGKFGDIVLADVLTSYAKVLADLFVALCMFLRPEPRGGSASATARPDRACGGAVAVPLVLAAPSLIRLRQCLIEYARVRRGPMSAETGWGGQHLANALEYGTAFPMIVLGALQRGGDGPSYHRAWVVACAVNSLYSFYWDVAKDWDLTLLGGRRGARDNQAFGLRRRLWLGPPALYYGVVALDLALRHTWALKLSARLGPLADLEGGLFLVQFLEVFRRWVWIFLRVETEWVRGQAALPSLDEDDILLGDFEAGGFQGKYEDED